MFEGAGEADGEPLLSGGVGSPSGVMEMLGNSVEAMAAQHHECCQMSPNGLL